MKYFLLICTLFVTFASTAQVTTDSNHESKVERLLNEIDTLITINNQLTEELDINMSLKNRYKMYPTSNIYNFLQLDTKTGEIVQIQWSLQKEKEFYSTINDEDLTYGKGYGSNSFELYPTQNVYQFLLLDKTSGRVWHVQWGLKDSERWIRRIY